MENAFSPANEKEAWIGILFACISSDKRLPEQETETLAHLLLIKEMFKSSEVLTIYRDCMLAHSKLGSKGLIDICISKVEDQNKPTLFAMAADLMLSDGNIQPEEKEILDYLSFGFSLNFDLKQKIIEVILIKNKGNKVI